MLSVAGGIGITLVLAMARELTRRGAEWNALRRSFPSHDGFRQRNYTLALITIHAGDRAGGAPGLETHPCGARQVRRRRARVSRGREGSLSTLQESPLVEQIAQGVG